MATIASLNIGLSANSARLSKDLDKARKRTRKFGEGAKKDFGGIGGSIKGLAGLIGGLAVGAALKQTVTDVREFGKAAAELSTLGFDDTQLKDFTKSARELAVQFGGSAKGQVEAYYQAVSAGATDFAEAQKIIEGANKLALGGVTDITTATDGLTSVLNAFGLSAKDVDSVSDTFFATMKAGKTTVEEISKSIGKVAPLASSLGLSFQETGAALSQITKSGINTSEAVSGLKAAFANIVKPSKQAMVLAEELGVAFNAQSLEAEGLVPFIQKLAKATGGNVTQMSQFFGSIEAVNTVLAISRGEGKGFADTLDGIRKSSGATAEAVDKVKGSLDFQLNKAGAQLRDLSITIGKAFLPVINDFLPVLTSGIESLANVIKFLTSSGSLSELFEGIDFSGLGNRAGEAIANGVKFIFSSDGGKAIATGLFNAVKAVFEGLGEFLVGLLKGAFKNFNFKSLIPSFGFGGDDAKTGGLVTKGGILKFQGGGFVPGRGNRDTLPAMLTPGELVLNRDQQSQLGSVNVGEVVLNISRDTDLDQLNEQMINKWGFGFAPRQGGLI